MARHRCVLVLVAALRMAGAGCGSTGDHTTRAAPAPTAPSAETAVAPVTGVTIVPPAPFTAVRTNTTRADVAAQSSAAAAASSAAPIAVDGGGRASLILDGDRVVAIRIDLPAGAREQLTKRWSEPLEDMDSGAGSTLPNRDLDKLIRWSHVWVWNDPISGWLARLVEVQGGTSPFALLLQNDRPDPALLEEGEVALGIATKLIGKTASEADAAREAAVKTNYRLFPTVAGDGRVKSVQIAFVYLDLPSSARWTWPALFRRRFGDPIVVGAPGDWRLSYGPKQAITAEEDRTNGRWLLSL